MSPRKTILASSLAALIGAGALIGSPAVYATGNIGAIWNLLAYPNSFSDNAAADDQGFFCALCHLSETGTGYNPYGQALRGPIPGGATQEEIIAAFRSIEALNSDLDPSGFSNIAEINAGTQPGWKVGDAVPQPLVGNLLDPVLTAPEINVAPVTIDYGAVVVGTSVTGTEVSISNTGSADLTVTDLTLTGDAVFSLGQQTPSRPFTIAAGATQTVGVVYTPDAEGLDTGALAITSNDADEPEVTVALRGTGVTTGEDCFASVTPPSLAFGQVLIGTPLQLPVTLTNVGVGSCDVDVSVPNCIDGEFVLTSPASLSVGAGESSIITVAYTPINLGADQCRIDVLTQGNDITVPMSGEGVDALPTDLDITSFSPSKTTTLSKGGIVTMSISIKNNGTGTAPGTLTIEGQQGNSQFIHQVVKVSDAVGGGATKIKLQAYIATVTGEIHWTATLQDGAPDTDEAFATTVVKK